MKEHRVLPKTLSAAANGLSIGKITTLLVLILCFGISPAWSAKHSAQHGAILYVKASAAADGDGTSWETAFNDLQDALAAAVSGDEIWVAEGTYKPTQVGDRSASFVLKSGVRVYGGFAGDENQLHKRQLDPSVTVLSGDIGTVGDDEDNSYHVVYAKGVTDAVLDGFTVTGGRGEGGGSVQRRGAGMYNEDSSLTVANCTFSDNRVAVNTHAADGWGGGMYNLDSAPIVTNCSFIANRAGNYPQQVSTGHGGGMYNEGHFGPADDPRWPIVTGCTFVDNVVSSKSALSPSLLGGGGGVCNYQCSPTIDGCTFAGNLAGFGGGILNLLSLSPITITNCIFNANSSIYQGCGGGAIYNFANNVTILNCTFYGNGWWPPAGDPRPYTPSGGAIWDDGNGSLITNCIFSGNGARGEGGAIRSTASPWRTTLYNCLFYENIRWGSLDTDAVSSDFDGVLNDLSVNNLYDSDPLLVDPAAGDFHLRYDSPCIDSGTTRKFAKLYSLPMPAKDYYGDTRIVDGDGDGVPAADIGVDEFIPNLPDLRAFLEALADGGELEETTAARLLDYVADAQAALDQHQKRTARGVLNELIDDVEASLGETEIAELIERKTEAVIKTLG